MSAWHAYALAHGSLAQQTALSSPALGRKPTARSRRRHGGLRTLRFVAHGGSANGLDDGAHFGAALYEREYQKVRDARQRWLLLWPSSRRVRDRFKESCNDVALRRAASGAGKSMDQMTITFLTASTALIAGIASPIVSIRVARQQFKTSVIANNRERWIESLRDAMAEYIAMVTSISLIARHTKSATAEFTYADPEFLKTAERIVFMRSKILLMTNPMKPLHRDLCQRIDTVHRVLAENRALEHEEWRAHLDAITLAGHKVLHAEWDRVKRGD